MNQKPFFYCCNINSGVYCGVRFIYVYYNIVIVNNLSYLGEY